MIIFPKFALDRILSRGKIAKKEEEA